MRLRATRKMDVRVEALKLDLSFAPREEMRTEISAKFTRERLARDMAAAGLELREVLTDDDGLFALSLFDASGVTGAPPRGEARRPRRPRAETSVVCRSGDNKPTKPPARASRTAPRRARGGRPIRVPPMDISGAGALVAGGASGLGAATARALHERGAD